MSKRFIALLFVTVLLGGCPKTTKPEMTSLEIQALQSREFATTKRVAFASVLSVFQDLGYIINSSDLETGLITAKSPTQGKAGFWATYMTDTKATAFVEELKPGTTKVRMNFVKSDESSDPYGMKKTNETPIVDGALYQNAFSRIQEAIFIRTATQ